MKEARGPARPEPDLGVSKRERGDETLPNDDPKKPIGEAQAIRCPCGRLLARRVPGGVELKCRRCRRLILVIAVEATDEVAKVGKR